MARLLYKLNGVPHDEVEEARQILMENNVDFYETPGGNWGVSVAAFWLKDESQWEHAKKLLEDYDVQRRDKIREEYEAAYSNEDSILKRIVTQPLRAFFYLLIVLAIIYFSTIPFLRFDEWL